MNVLLTGSTGFLGQHVKDYLSSNPTWKIACPMADLTRTLSIMGPFDYIINLASKSSVEESVKQPVEFIRDNVAITTNLLEYARKYKPKVFLQMSTVEVYNVTNPYAASKAAQEEIANAYWKTYDIPVMIARSSNIVGEGQSEDKFVPKIIKQIKAGETVKIYTSNGKQGSRIYNPVLNVASAIRFMLELYPELQNYDDDFPVHFDIGGGQKMTNLAMAKLIADKLGKPLKYELYEPKVQRPTYAKTLTVTGSKLEDYGWRPPQTLERGLAWIQ